MRTEGLLTKSVHLEKLQVPKARVLKKRVWLEREPFDFRQVISLLET